MTRIPKTFAKKVDWRRFIEDQRLRTAHQLGPQLYVHEHNLVAPTISAIRNDRKRLSKPFGGLWTSTYDAEYGSDWVRWCVAYRYTDPFESHWTVLLAPQTARVATVDSPADLAGLIERYPRKVRRDPSVDFELLSQDYDCLHLTLKVTCKHDQAPGATLRAWDCESTVWFRWIFREWHDVKPHFQGS
jgi:hypothetical protein